jgi:hypothetical protein
MEILGLYRCPLALEVLLVVCLLTLAPEFLALLVLSTCTAVTLALLRVWAGLPLCMQGLEVAAANFISSRAVELQATVARWACPVVQAHLQQVAMSWCQPSLLTMVQVVLLPCAREQALSTVPAMP